MLRRGWCSSLQRHKKIVKIHGDASTKLPRGGCFSTQNLYIHSQALDGRLGRKIIETGPQKRKQAFVTPQILCMHNMSTLSTVRLNPLFGNGLNRRSIRFFSEKSKGEKDISPPQDETVASSNPRGLLLGMIGLSATTVYALTNTPDDIRWGKGLKHSSANFEEIDVEDHLSHQMQVISADIRGEITRAVLGDDVADQLAEDSERNKAAGNTAEVVSDVLNSDALQNAIASLITRVVSSSAFQNACQTLLKNLWHDLVNDPETVAQVVALLNTAIKDEQIKRSFKELLLGLLQDEEVYNELTGLVVKLGEDSEVLAATKELLTESAHKALNDAEILDHSMEFAADVVGDNVLQKTSGEALRNTVTYAVRPSLSAFLSVFGLALLFFSASALGQARSAAHQGREIDAATSAVAQGVGKAIVTSLTKILSLPASAVKALGRGFTKLVTIPYQLVGALAISIANAGGSAISIIQKIVLNILASPGILANIIKSGCKSLQSSVLSSVRFVAVSPRVLLDLTKSGISSLQVQVVNFLANVGSSAAVLPQLLIIQVKLAVSSLTAGLVTTTKNIGNSVQSSISYQFNHIAALVSASLSSFGARCSNSLDIMTKNTLARGRWQMIRWNDFSGKLFLQVKNAVLSAFHRRGNSGTPDTL